MKKISSKILVFLFVSMFAIVNINTVAHAHVINDSSTNNTKETAKELQLNTLQDSLTWHVKILGSCRLNNSNEVDWYKVNMPAGKQTITINSAKSLTASIYSDSECTNIISKSIHGDKTKQSHKFEVNAAGVYYVKIEAAEKFDTQNDYSIMVGAPWYKSGSYSQSLNTDLALNPRNTESRTVYFNISDNSIPESAVVRSISIRGNETNKYYVDDKIRSIKPFSGYAWTNMRGPAMFSEDVLNTNNPMKLKQGWAFKHSVSGFFGSYNYYSLNPVIDFEYLYEDENL